MGRASVSYRVVIVSSGSRRGRGSSAVDGIISPPAGESSGAARGRFELSIMGFRTGFRLERPLVCLFSLG